jgi:hypothetical protein
LILDALLPGLRTWPVVEHGYKQGFDCRRGSNSP